MKTLRIIWRSGFWCELIALGLIGFGVELLQIDNIRKMTYALLLVFGGALLARGKKLRRQERKKERAEKVDAEILRRAKNA